MIIGEPLLKNLYMVYDFEHDLIKLGVNVDSQSNVMIYTPGQRPVPEVPKAQNATSAAQTEERIDSDLDVHFQ